MLLNQSMMSFVTLVVLSLHLFVVDARPMPQTQEASRSTDYLPQSVSDADMSAEIAPRSPIGRTISIASTDSTASGRSSPALSPFDERRQTFFSPSRFSDTLSSANSSTMTIPRESAENVKPPSSGSTRIGHDPVRAQQIQSPIYHQQKARMILEGRYPTNSNGLTQQEQKRANRQYHLSPEEVIQSQRQQSLAQLEGKIAPATAQHIAHFASKWI